MITGRAGVTYKKQTSDVELEIILERITYFLGRDIVVHSGDRKHVPKGGAKKSLHLRGRAVDLHVAGMSDEQVFSFLKLHKSRFFQSHVNRYEVIHHGKHTKTEGQHVHVGQYPAITGEVKGPGVVFMVEGLTEATKGHYSVVK